MRVEAATVDAQADLTPQRELADAMRRIEAASRWRGPDADVLAAIETFLAAQPFSTAPEVTTAVRVDARRGRVRRLMEEHPERFESTVSGGVKLWSSAYANDRDAPLVYLAPTPG